LEPEYERGLLLLAAKFLKGLVRRGERVGS